MNSRPHEDIAFRDAYRMREPRCELYDTLLPHLPRGLRGDVDPWKCDVHHIVFCNRQRFDLLSNLISVSHDLHVPWIHANPVDARIVCWSAKLLKREWNVWEVDECFGAMRDGAAPTLVWLEDHAASEWLRTMQEGLIDEYLRQSGELQ